MKIIFILLLIMPNKVIASENLESRNYIEEIASLEYLNGLYVDKIKELEGQVSILIGNIKDLSLNNIAIKNKLNENNKEMDCDNDIKKDTVSNNQILFSGISILFIFLYILYVRKKSIKKKV